MAKITPEGRVKVAVRALLKVYGVTYVKTPTTAGYGASGDFDIRCVFHGVSIGIETKATAEDTPTALQTKNAVEHFDAGGVSLCIHKDNFERLKSVLMYANRHRNHAPFMCWHMKALEKYFKQQKGNDDVTVN